MDATGANLTDDLVRAAAGGDAAARETVLRLWSARLPAMVAARLSPAPDQLHLVDDLAQQALVCLDEALRRLREPTAAGLRATASTIVARRVADYLRGPDGPRGPRVGSLDSTWHSASAHTALRDLIPATILSPRSAAVNAETLRLALAALGRLKAEHREIVTLAFFDQLSMSEVADRLGITRPAASMLLLRAVRSIRQSLTDADDPGEAHVHRSK